MAAQQNTFKVGLTLIAFLTLFVAVLVFIAGGVRTGGEQFVVRFPSEEMTARLKKGGEVVCGGQTVGTIRAVDLRDAPGPDGTPRLYVYVTADVSAKVALQEGCEIVPGEPLLGEVSRLVIRNRGGGRPVDPSKPVEGQKAASFSTSLALLQDQLDPRKKDSLVAMIRGQLDVNNAASLLAKIHKSLDDLNEVTRNVSLQLNPGQRNVLMAKLHAVLDNINSATGALRDQTDPQRGEAAMAKIHAALDSLNKALATVTATLEESRAPVRDTLAHVRNTARILAEEIAPRVSAQVDVENAAGLLAEVHVAMDRLNRSFADINRITGTGRDVIVSNKDAIGKIVANLLDTSELIKAGIRDVTLHPWRLFKEPSPQEQQQRNIVDTARMFSNAATQLDNATLRLKAVMDADGATPGDAEELIRIRDALQRSLEQFGQAEQALWKQLEVR